MWEKKAIALLAPYIGIPDMATQRDLGLTTHRVDFDYEDVLRLVQRANRIALIVAAESDAGPTNPASNQFTRCASNDEMSK